MTSSASDLLIRQLIGGDPNAATSILDRAQSSDEPVLLVAAALIIRDEPRWLARAAVLADTTRDRQLLAIAAAHLANDHDRVDALARDHLVDHPDNIFVSWIAAGAGLPVPPG